MKKGDLALISVLGKGIKIVFILLMLFSHMYSTIQQNSRINEIYLKFDNRADEEKTDKYKLLVNIKNGDFFNYKEVRKTMQNLYKTGLFSNIEIKIEKLNGNKINLYFVLEKKYRIRSIKVKSDNHINVSTLLNAIFSLRENTYFDKSRLNKAFEEIRNFLNSRGYFNPEIHYQIFKDNNKSEVKIKYLIKTGRYASAKKINFKIDSIKSFKNLRKYLDVKRYIPYKFQKKIEKVKKLLKKQKYYFPEISWKMIFLNESKSLINLDININPGFKYIFQFQGIKNKLNLISSIWEKKRFEKWAENESRAIIQNFLRNNGFLNAEVYSNIVEKNNVKYITFTVKKNKKYVLGDISFSGNQSFPSNRLKKVIKTDDSIFNKLFWLKANSLIVDREVIKYFYHFNGFPLAKIIMKPSFRKNRADIEFIITENKKFIVDSVFFKGNKYVESEELYSILESKKNSPFVQQKISEDIERLKNYYYFYGFDNIDISIEISTGTKKSILININEGESFETGDLIIVGASNAQKNLVKKLFPLSKNSFFNRIDFERFKSDIENSGIFNEIRIEKIYKEPNTIDLIIKVIPDRSRYYGFRIGWEDRKLGKGFLTEFVQGLRGTLEYQERNIFSSYSSLSAIFQIGINEKRKLVVSYDTPYFMKSKMDSSFRIWQEDEVYHNYKFNRFGVGESIIKRVSVSSYILASLNWYRTKLTDINITETEIDNTKSHFDTTALNFSYVIENRDDPFNPTTGDYFSSDVKFGLPIFKNNYFFFKFFLRYQKNFKFLRNGTFAFSVRNGFASGDMSITERFFAGDIRTFRGIGNYRLGPIDSDPEKNAPMGGNAVLLLNLEVTFPIMIIPINDLHYSIFADMGNIYNKASDFDLGRLEKAIGVSIKYKTPLGPFKIAFAWNLKTREDSNFEIHWGIGNAF